MLDAEQGRHQDQGLGWERYATITGLLALTLRAGLGSSGRLTYHEALVAQPAREWVAQGWRGADWLVPTVGGQPWLEKPPLLTWLVAGLELVTGDATEWAARTPSALAASSLVLIVAALACRRFGPTVGFLAGLIQATTAWLILRGRLAEADILLAALVAALMLAFDHLRTPCPARPDLNLDPLLRGPHRRPVAALVGEPSHPATTPALAFDPAPWVRWFRPEVEALPRLAPGVDRAPAQTSVAAWRWAFWVLLGLTALAKGIGFGAALVLPALAALVVWDRDGGAVRRVWHLPGLLVAVLLALLWPLLVVARHPEALQLWTLHVVDRLSDQPSHFTGGPRWLYPSAVALQVLPWTPVALLALRPSWRRARRERGGGDRLLWAWALVPVAVLSLATVKNAHYAIHALPPWSIWAAQALARLGAALDRFPWGRPGRSARLGAALFGTLGLATAVGFGALAPRLDARGAEWTWLESLGGKITSGQPVVFLYEDWDRQPYPTPFGPVPHDWGIRLFALGGPATWRQGLADLQARPAAPTGQPFLVVGRARDIPGLTALGRVEVVSRGPTHRWDRAFALLRVVPEARRCGPAPPSPPTAAMKRSGVGGSSLVPPPPHGLRLSESVQAPPA